MIVPLIEHVVEYVQIIWQPLVLLRQLHIERVNQNRTRMTSACQQSHETLTTAALNIQDEISTNQLALKQDLHHVVHGHLLQKAFHEHAAINHMATNYLKVQFPQSLNY